MVECKHDLTDLLFRAGGSNIYQKIGLKYCPKCEKIYKETLKEIAV